MPRLYSSTSVLCSRLFAAARQRSFDAERLSERVLHSSQRKEGDHVGEKALKRTHSQIMWVLADVVRLFSNNMGSVSRNVGQRAPIFSAIGDRIDGCYRVLPFMFSGRYTYPDVQDSLTPSLRTKALRVTCGPRPKGEMV